MTSSAIRSSAMAIVLTATGCASSAASSPGAAAPPSVVAPGLSRLQFYVGRWACDGTEWDKPGASPTHHKVGVRVAPVLDGTWLSVAVFQGDLQVTTELKGFDASTHEFRHLWVTRDGSSGSLTSKGWSGDRLVFDEDHPAPGARSRMTFQRIDDTHFDHRAEIDEGSGYRLEYQKQCHKVG
jgi:hypothetical protein